MGFGEAFKTCMRKYADFNGRASRSEYWWFYLALSLISIPFAVLASFAFVALFIPVFVEATDGTPDNVDAGDLYWGPLVVVWALLVVVQLVFLLPSYASQVRRLHDTGQPGAFVLLNLVGLGIVPLIMCIMDPTPGDNQYGPDPREAFAA